MRWDYVSLLSTFISYRQLINLAIDTILEILQVRHSNSIVKGKYAVLDGDTEGFHHRMSIQHKGCSKKRVTIECKHVNHMHAIEISVRMCSNKADCGVLSYKESRKFVEPLTLAYI